MDSPVQQAPDPSIEVDNTMETTTRIPTIAVYGCGGCGTNLVNKFACSVFSHEGGCSFDETPYMAVIDTSHSNFRNLDRNIEVFCIGDKGSGKKRDTNVDQIQRELIEEKFMDNKADINIIVSSLAGGSGSVIMPLLAKEFAMDNKAVVLMLVCDSGSHRSAVNSINTLMTLENFSQEQEHYYPLMIYNNQDAGRVAVDKFLTMDLNMLIDLMTSHQILELDYQDKMYFLKPELCGVGHPGVYAMGISNSNELQAPEPGDNKIVLAERQSVHATLCVNEEGRSLPLMAEIDYVGISSKQYAAVIGVDLNKDLINSLKKAEDMYAKRSLVQSSNVSTSFKNVKKESHASGMVM